MIGNFVVHMFDAGSQCGADKLYLVCVKDEKRGIANKFSQP